MISAIPHITSGLQPSWGLAAFLDTETTGLHPGRHEVIELAVALFAYERESGAIVGIIDEYCGLREPACPISASARRIHGISRKMTAGQTLDADKIERIIARAEFIVAHNAGFDRGFIGDMFPTALEKPWYCSMNGIHWRRMGFPSKGLQNLLAAHRIEVSQAHRAGADVQACLMLLSQMNNEGVHYLLELIKGRKFGG